MKSIYAGVGSMLHRLTRHVVWINTNYANRYLQLVDHSSQTNLGTPFMGLWACLDGALYYYRFYLRHGFLQSLY